LCWHYVELFTVISSCCCLCLHLLLQRQFILLCPQSHVPIPSADCFVCIVTKMCPSVWSSFIKLLLEHLLIVVTVIAVFLLSVRYLLPKETHLCCGSITMIYPTRYQQYREQYQHNSKLLQCTVHCLVRDTYCAPRYFLQLNIWETNILNDGFVQFIVLTDDWALSPTHGRPWFLKYCCTSKTAVWIFRLKLS
jgi:hypothetical protein